MSLAEHLQRAGDEDALARVDPLSAKQADALAQFKQQINDVLHERLGTRLFDPNLDESQLHDLVAVEIAAVMGETSVPLTEAERDTLVADLLADVMGFGPIERFMSDPSVTEIMVNGTQPIYVERLGHIESTGFRFQTDDHLLRVIDRIVTRVGRRVDEASPMVDARLADGSRVNAVIPPLAVDGPSLTIRKFSRDVLGIDELIDLGSIDREVADFLSAVVHAGLTVLVSGGTGSGKTTLLNILSSEIPEGERIVSIEDSVELQLHQPHVVRLESRPPNIEGRGEVTIRDLLKNSLRMRPDRIIIGEVRSGEALDLLQAINTGHDGSLSTIHANSPRDALSRLETMVLMAGFDLPLRAIREQISSGIDVVVQVQRMRDGSRRVTHVSEVVGMEGDVITMNDLYVFEQSSGGDGSPIVGRLRSTGVRPDFIRRLPERFQQLGRGDAEPDARSEVRRTRRW